MKKKFTKGELLSNRGCFTRDKVNNFNCVKSNNITLVNLSKEVSLEDITWFILNKCDMTHKEIISLAIQCIKNLILNDEDNKILKSIESSFKSKKNNIIKSSSLNPSIDLIHEMVEGYINDRLDEELIMVKNPLFLIALQIDELGKNDFIDPKLDNFLKEYKTKFSNLIK